jgi:NAD(P)-dependent dehydrogenase (short-subunit alcohol dehydrogenase family)
MNILITGSYGFIGSFLKQELTKHGHTIIDFDLHDPHRPVNACIEKDVIQYFDYLKSTIPSIDVLINCIGIPNSANQLPHTDITEISTESFENLLDINLTAVFTIIREFTRTFYAPNVFIRKGCIINISSLYSVVSPRLDLYNGKIKHPGYVASKFGLVGLTKYLAVLLANRGITVNCIAPAAVAETLGVGGTFLEKYNEQVPMKKPVAMSEILGVINMLIHSHTITGQNIIIDGGYTLW